MITAALATIPGREEALALCLASLRPQVDHIRVVCHDMERAPECVAEIADSWLCMPDTLGSAAKLTWARSVEGLYLACDDDIEYPPDYAATMLRWVKRWKGRALVTCHGRVLKRTATSFLDADAAYLAFRETEGAWLNYPGGLGLAFDTRLRVPAAPYVTSCEEAGLAVWAQGARIPIWLVPHPEGWLKWLAPPGKSIWAEEKATAFERRNSVLAPVGRSEVGWRLITRKVPI